MTDGRPRQPGAILLYLKRIERALWLRPAAKREVLRELSQHIHDLEERRGRRFESVAEVSEAFGPATRIANQITQSRWWFSTPVPWAAIFTPVGWMFIVGCIGAVLTQIFAHFSEPTAWTFGAVLALGLGIRAAIASGAWRAATLGTHRMWMYVASAGWVWALYALGAILVVVLPDSDIGSIPLLISQLVWPLAMAAAVDWAFHRRSVVLPLLLLAIAYVTGFWAPEDVSFGGTGGIAFSLFLDALFMIGLRRFHRSRHGSSGNDDASFA
jgi:hypothetical protein